MNQRNKSDERDWRETRDSGLVCLVCLVYLVCLVCMVGQNGKPKKPNEPYELEEPNRQERRDLRGSIQVLHPMRRDLVAGGSISWRMASKRDLICPSWLTTFRSSSLSLAANSLCVLIVCLNRTKARTTKTLMLIACGLFNTLAAMMAPCS